MNATGLAVGLLVVGLVVGAGITFVAVPSQSKTTTLVSTLESPTTLTTSVVSSVVQVQTQTQTETISVTHTVETTTTSTSTVTKLATGPALVNFSGSGEESGPPFTATTQNTEIQISITATAPLSDVEFAWYIYQTGASSYTCQGSVGSQQGSFTNYCYGLSVGVSYYVRILAANCDWQTSVVPFS